MFLEIPQGSEGDSNCISLKQVALPKLTAEYQALTHQAPYTGGYTGAYTKLWMLNDVSRLQPFPRFCPMHWDFCEEATHRNGEPLYGNEEATHDREEALHGDK